MDDPSRSVALAEGRASLDSIVAVSVSETARRVCETPANLSASEAAKSFQIRLADTEGRRNKASILIKERYEWRGYAHSGLKNAAPGQITLLAEGADGPIGTMTLGIDIGSGLNCDQVYGDIVARWRGRNERVGEISGFAAQTMQHSKHVLGALFHVLYLYARMIHGVTHVFAEVNPRHVSFHRRSLGFREAGEVRHCPRAGAPAVLLHLPLSHMDEQLAALGGTAGKSSSKSLYPYCFSPAEAEGILGRIRARR